MSSTFSPTEAQAPKLVLPQDNLAYWKIGLGIPVYLSIQLLLRLSLDLRDLPGAASTKSILYAIDNPRSVDAASYAFRWLNYWLNIPLDIGIQLLSIGSGLSMVVGLILFATSLVNKRAGMWAGIFGACWPLTQFLGLLIGLDSLAIGTSWLALGLFSVSIQSSWWGLPLLPLSLWLLILGLDVKSIALPSLVGLIGVILPTKIHRWKVWGSGLVLALVFATTQSGTDDHRVQAPDLNWQTVQHGWHRLSDLPKRGLAEGDFQILWWTGGLLTLSALGRSLWRTRKFTWAHTPLLVLLMLWMTTGLGLCVTAAGLGELCRPRYLVGMGLGLLIPIAGGLSRLKSVFSAWMGMVIVLAMLLNMWGFFGQWGQIRHTMLGGHSPHIPTAPSIWGKKYQRYPTLTLRDLTMVGALDFQDTWQSIPNTSGIAVPRLRDDRHKNLEAYATMRDQEIVILDPGKCCAGTPVNAQCAQRVLKALDEAHYTVVLPAAIAGVERVHANERPWIESLRDGIAQTGSNSLFWHWQTSDAVGEASPVPCQFEVPKGLKH